MRDRDGMPRGAEKEGIRELSGGERIEFDERNGPEYSGTLVNGTLSYTLVLADTVRIVHRWERTAPAM